MSPDLYAQVDDLHCPSGVLLTREVISLSENTFQLVNNVGVWFFFFFSLFAFSFGCFEGFFLFVLGWGFFFLIEKRVTLSGWHTETGNSAFFPPIHNTDLLQVF